MMNFLLFWVAFFLINTESIMNQDSLKKEYHKKLVQLDTAFVNKHKISYEELSKEWVIYKNKRKSIIDSLNKYSK